jgi:transcriptional regulator with XRE-family HTH domain
MMTKPSAPKRHVIQDQFATLLAEGRSSDGKVYSVQALVEAIQVSDQALRNLLNGKTISPRLETARSICHFYGITLDYFSLDSAAACQTYLLHCRQHTSPTLRSIDEQGRQLSPAAMESLIRVALWIRAKGEQGEERPKSTARGWEAASER